MSVLLGMAAAAASCRSSAPSDTVTGSVLDASGADADAPRTSRTMFRYAGYTAAAGRQYKIATVLDLVEDGGDGTTTLLRGVLRFHPGGFDSAEYQSHYLPSVRRLDETGALSIAAAPGEPVIEFTAVEASGIAGRLQSGPRNPLVEFQLRPADGGITLETLSGIFPDLPVLPHLTGQYRGQCQDGIVALQLEASRWQTPGSAAADQGLRLDGRLVQVSDAACGSSHECVRAAATDVRSDALDGRFDPGIRGFPGNCVFSGSGITCGAGCGFTRTRERSHAVLDSAPASTGGPVLPALGRQTENPGENDDSDSATGRRWEHGGQYYGWLRHERTDSWQLVAFNVRSLPVEIPQTAPAGSEHVAAMATLYFGEGDSSEFVAYRFAEVIPPARGGAFMLDGEGEAFFRVSSWSKDRIVGDWYSKTFGRVGRLTLQRDLVPDRPAGARIMQPLAGLYSGGAWEFELGINADLSPGPASFWPLHGQGWAREQLVNARRRAIKDLSYDFYTGSVAIRLDDGRVATGRVDADGMRLFWPPVPRTGAPAVSGTVTSFKRTATPHRPQAANGARREPRLVRSAP